VEAAAEGSDALMEKYFESGSLTDEEVIKGLKAVVVSGSHVPVFVAAGSAEIGLAPFLQGMIDLVPSPRDAPAVVAAGKAGDETLTAEDSGPLAVYVWKTTADPFVGKQTYLRVYSGTLAPDSRIWNQSQGTEERLGNVYIPRGKETLAVKNVHAGDICIVPKLSETLTTNTLCDKNHPLTLPIPEYPHALYRVALFPKTQADSTKMSAALTRLVEEDMTLSWQNDPTTLQMILQGMGDQHIDVAIRRAESKFQVGVNIAEPKVPYQETITKPASAMYRHKKQTGGHGQYGKVVLEIAPLPRGEKYRFINAIFGGAISKGYIPGVERASWKP